MIAERHTLRIGIALACISVAAANSVFAQAPAISSTSPQAAKPGASVDVTIRGSNLTGATQLWSSFAAKSVLASGVKENGKSASQVVFRVTVPANTPPGIHGIRVGTPNGVSALKLFVIDDLPSVAQKAGNTSFATAQPVKLPIAIDGTVAALTRNYYQFTAKAGETVSFEALARRIGSPLDPTISLFAITKFGPRELGYSDDALGLSSDSQFAYKIPTAGDYVLEIRDIRYLGGANHRYRLRIGDFPCVTSAYPMSVDRGAKTTLTFAGSDIGSAEPVTVQAPMSNRNGSLAVAVKRKGGKSSGFAIVSVSDSAAKEFLETEPNNDAKKPNTVALGRHLNGRLNSTGDIDHFGFTAKKGQKFTFAAVTRSQGSPVDLKLTLLNDKGATLSASNDAGTTVPVLTYTFPADGKYVLAVRDLNRRGGTRFVYRVRVTPVQPGFTLTASADRANVPVGGTAAVTVTSTRTGYNGPIAVKLEGLPAGITSIPTVLGPGRNSVILTLTSTAQAKRGVISAVRIVGTGTVGKTTLTVAGSISAAISKAASGMAYPPGTLTSSFAVAVAPAAPMTLRTSPATITIARGKNAKVKVTLKRGTAITEAVSLAVSPVPKKNTKQAGLPAGITVAAKPIAKGKNKIEFVISATAKAPKGTFTVTLIATHKKGKATITQNVPGITITIP